MVIHGAKSLEGFRWDWRSRRTWAEEIAGGLWMAVGAVLVGLGVDVVKGAGCTEYAFDGWLWVRHDGSPDEALDAHGLC